MISGQAYEISKGVGPLEYNALTHAKNRIGRQESVQKASQTFFDNTSVHQNIVKSISNIYSDLQKLPISPSSYYSYSYDFLVSMGYRKIAKISYA